MTVIVRGKHGTVSKREGAPTCVYLELGTNKWREEPAIRLLGKPTYKGSTYARWKGPDLGALDTEGIGELRDLLEPEGETTTLAPTRCLCSWCKRHPQEEH